MTTQNWRGFLWAAAIAGALVMAGCGGDDDDGGGSLSLVAVAGPPEQVGAAVESTTTVEVTSEDGAPRAGVDVLFEVRRGGGVLPDGSRMVAVTTDQDGRASVAWRSGIVPVVNQLDAVIADETVTFETRVVLADPFDSEQFGDIPDFLRGNGFTTIEDGEEVFLASTEDLAFAGDGLLLGLAAGTTAIDGALVEMDSQGDAVLVDLSGDPLVGVLGIALDRDGALWAVDPRGPEVGALVRIATDGVVETVLTSTGQQDLDAPNYVAVGPDGRVYFSDPCLGVIVRYDPEAEQVDGVLTTDVATQGGPNGLAFDATGETLYFATESIALLCGRSDLDLVDPVAGLFRTTVGENGFGALEPIAERRGLFGDGLAFDGEGNLYVIFDTQMNFMLSESAVWVLPSGEPELVKFLSNPGERVYANLAWGNGAFGDETLYIALLAVDAFGLPVRGVERIDIGIPGLPLLPD